MNRPWSGPSGPAEHAVGTEHVDTERAAELHDARLRELADAGEGLTAAAVGFGAAAQGVPASGLRVAVQPSELLTDAGVVATADATGQFDHFVDRHGEVAVRRDLERGVAGASAEHAALRAR